MHITAQLTDQALLEELGARLKAHRIEAGLTQAELAFDAGIGKRTLERLEAGQGADVVMLIRVLRILGRVDGLDRLLPPVEPGPIAQLERKQKPRKRVAHPRKPRPQRPEGGRTAWTWKE
ncbi:MAG TPA: helix-turn-helix transcriptional regulator [Woeseiaceae bacterium]